MRALQILLHAEPYLNSIRFILKHLHLISQDTLINNFSHATLDKEIRDTFLNDSWLCFDCDVKRLIDQV